MHVLSPFLFVRARGSYAVATWSGPHIRPVFNTQGLSALSIDSVVSAPGFLVGNTQGGLKDKWADWAVELTSAKAAGVRIIGVCPSGEDLCGPYVQLSAHTRSMIDRVLASFPEALILPRVPMCSPSGTASPVVQMSMNGSLTPGRYGSMTATWTAAAAESMGKLLRLMDAAYPGQIAGVHLAGLAAGEMRYECPPEGVPGYSDYSVPMQARHECLSPTPMHPVARATIPACWVCTGPGTPQMDLCALTQADYCDELRAADPRAECAVPTAAERCTPQTGNLFVSNASASFNAFSSRKVQEAISAHAAAAKAAMEGKGLVLAFYGYLNELGGWRTAAGGHLALAALLQDRNVDGIMSPYKYDELYRQPTGPFVTMGPSDSPRLYGKLWISEDDTRTSFSGATPGGLAFACAAGDAACDASVMRRNILTAALHGSGLYQFDLPMAGWFGQAGAGANTTAALWEAIGSARRAAEKLYGAAGGALQPEVAILLDDASMAHTRADALGSGTDAVADPINWLNDLPSQLAQIGAPVRHFHLRDLEQPSAATAMALAPIKLAVLPNAFALSGGLRAAVAAFAANRSVLYYYAPGAISPATGHVDFGGVSELVGCPMLRGAGNLSMHSVLEAPPKQEQPVPVGQESVGMGCPDMSSLAGMSYGPTFSGRRGGGVLDPWGHLDETSPDAAACTVLGRYISGERLPSAVCTSRGERRSFFSAAPLPPAALRIIARHAGVHLYLNTSTAGGECSGDGVEAAGAGLLLRGGPHAVSSTPRPVALPTRTGGSWTVTDEQGVVVCERCFGFVTTLAAGEVRLYYVIGAPPPAPEEGSRYM